ncbi:MAG: hypothetical protein M3P27_05815 [Acidobacteriota bacterium]|nr:hypothetical protein [Acidobacteriota bacterium]
MGSASFTKRQKEHARQEKQKMKAERRLQRKQEKLNPSAEVTDEMLLAEGQLGEQEPTAEGADAQEAGAPRAPGADDGV